MRLRINGHDHELDAPAHLTLLEVLRERLGLTGTKLVCGRGECGACTVLLDGEPAYACLTLAAACGTRAITTIEGVAPEGGVHPLQDAFIDHDALQCGFCTPGQIMSLKALFNENRSPSDEDIVRAVSGNLCRCGAYRNILRAARIVAGRE
jgi:aerobic-type carbon monoxide dehydrogenase small subunit (CoxS/CutS family)